MDKEVGVFFPFWRGKKGVDEIQPPTMGRLGLVDLGGWGPGWLDVRQENARIPRL